MKGIKEYLTGEKVVIQICDKIGINKVTFYDWMKIYNDIEETNLINL